MRPCRLCYPFEHLPVKSRHTTITDADYLGARSIIDGHHKLIIQEKKGKTMTELYDLKIDPAEKNDLGAQQPERVAQLKADLKKWQDSVLESLLGKDYR